MADKPKGSSFSRLLRGSGGSYSEKESSAKTAPKLNLGSEEKEDKSRRRPIFLPFARKEGEQVLFALTYKEWAFLMGAMLMLFGGMGVIRMLAPKEPPTPQWNEVADVAPLDDSSRPPAGGEGEDVVTQMQARDTTRLVAPPSGMGVEEKKKEEPGKGPLGGVFDGLRAAERESPPRPRLPGMLGALSAALGGLSGSSSVREPPPMSPEEISRRLQNIPAKGSRGERGSRLGYSGSQNVPGFNVGRRYREESSAGDYGKARDSARADLNEKYKGAEKAAADAGKPFGETSRGNNEAQGAVTGGGDVPRQDGGGGGNVNYQIQRPPPDPMARENWETNRPWEDAVKQGFNKGLVDATAEAVKEIAKPVAGLVGKPLDTLGNRIGKMFEESDPPNYLAINQMAFFKKYCDLSAQSIPFDVKSVSLATGETHSKYPQFARVVYNWKGVKKGKNDKKDSEDSVGSERPQACMHTGSLTPAPPPNTVWFMDEQQAVWWRVDDFRNRERQWPFPPGGDDAPPAALAKNPEPTADPKVDDPNAVPPSTDPALPPAPGNTYEYDD